MTWNLTKRNACRLEMCTAWGRKSTLVVCQYPAFHLRPVWQSEYAYLIISSGSQASLNQAS
jgi:hypothetical protein